MGRIRNFGNKAQGYVFIGGAEPVADDDSITLAGKVFRFVVDAGDEADGEFPIELGGSVALTVTAAIAAINANPPSPGIKAKADPISNKMIRLYADMPGANGNVALVVAMTDGANVRSAATLEYGENPDNQTLHRGSYVVKATEAALSIVIESGLVSPRFVLSEVRSSTGDLKEALTNLLTVSGTELRYDGTGATDLATGDVINWQAWE